MRLHHVQLAIPQGGEGAARRFYGDALGLTEVAKPPALAARGGCWFRGDHIELHLGVEAAFRPARKAHSRRRLNALSRKPSWVMRQKVSGQTLSGRAAAGDCRRTVMVITC